MASRKSHTSTLTCKADSATFPVLILQMGIPDEEARYTPRATVNVYQGGSVKHSYSNVVSGSLIDTTLALAAGEDISVEMVCHSTAHSGLVARQCKLHFLEAKLYTGGSSTSTTVRSSSPQQLPQTAGASNPNQGLQVLERAPQGAVPGSASPTSVVVPEHGGHTPPDSNASGGHTPPSQGAGNVLEETKNTAENVRGTVEEIQKLRNIFKGW